MDIHAKTLTHFWVHTGVDSLRIQANKQQTSQPIRTGPCKKQTKTGNKTPWKYRELLKKSTTTQKEMLYRYNTVLHILQVRSTLKS